MNKLSYNDNLKLHILWLSDLHINIYISPKYLAYFTGTDGKFRKINIDTNNGLLYYITCIKNKRYIVEDIFKIRLKDFVVTTKGDKYLYCEENFNILNKTEQNLRKNLENKGYTIIRYVGHITNSVGKEAYRIKNPKWIVKQNKTGKQYCIMYCEPHLFVKIDENLCDDIHNILNKSSTWYGITDKTGKKTTKYYIVTHTSNIYLHQHILNFKGYGKGQQSINHINGNTLDNRKCNLEITSQSHQNRDRPDIKNKKCPDDVKSYMKEKYGLLNLPRFISYRHEPKDNKKYFIIEKHPNLKKRSVTSKKGVCSSNGYNNINKFEEILKIYRELEGGKLYFETNDYTEIKSMYDYLPDNCSLSKHKGKVKLKYDDRNKSNRKTLTYSISDNLNEKENIKQFFGKVKEKYDIELNMEANNTHEDKIEKLNVLIKDMKYVKTVNKGTDNFGLYYETPSGYKKYMAYDNETPINEFCENFCKNINKRSQKTIKIVPKQ